MLNKNIIRAWKDKDYFESLSQQEQARVPENPAGMLELSEEEMYLIAGGKKEKKDKSLKHYTKKCMYIVSNFCAVSVDTCLSFYC